MAKTAFVDIDDALSGLDRLSTLREPVARAMGVAMGQTVRDEAKDRAPTLLPENLGTDNQQADTLKNAIYLAFDDRRSILNAGQFIYAVSWNHLKAPHGHLLEFGHWLTYEYEKTPQGLFYTPLEGTKRDASGRRRGYGRPNTSPNGFFVHAIPFLGPAFDSKLPNLQRIAANAAAAKFSELAK